MFDEKTISQLEGSEETLGVRRGKKKNRRAISSTFRSKILNYPNHRQVLHLLKATVANANQPSSWRVATG